MNNNNGSMICALTCWGVALFAGVVATVMLIILGGWMFIQGAFIGSLVFLFGGALMSWLLCRPLPPLNAVQDQVKTTAATAPEATSAPAPAAKAAPASKESASEAPSSEAPAPVAPAPAAAAPATSGPAVMPSARLAGQDELATRKGAWAYQGDTPPPAKPPAAAAAAAPAEAETDGPETLSAARDGKADDLKLLKGVGPKLEETLNEMGFYHFDQIASWSDAHVAWVDERLTFKGRIERDGWIEQAKILAAGGETEFSKRKK